MTKTRYPGLTLRILARSRPAMGPGKAELLEHIEATGSISAAAIFSISGPPGYSSPRI